MFDLKNICRESKYEKDDFVGLRFENGSPKVIFPKGFSMPKDEEQARKDVVRLLSVIRKYGAKEQGTSSNSLEGEVEVGFPILSYQYIMNDYLVNGYYVERETQYTSGTRGKINWKRTIQKKTPVYNNGNVVYLDFVVKTNKINENNLLTHIHEYCVKESFDKLGWLYLTNDISLRKPSIQMNKNLFVSVLQEALNSTFNEYKRKLFQSMLNIVEHSSDEIDFAIKASLGVDKFEVVWEAMLDDAFGEENKSEYFPRATWHIMKDDNKHISSTLRPDTIMIYEGKLYILDAKYYRYGIDENDPRLLPHTADIAKQIVYGEYVEDNKGFKGDDIYNAFIIPFERQKDTDLPYKFVSVGTTEWKKYNIGSPNYYYVLGILMDTRYLIEQCNKENESEIEKLSELIESSLAKFRSDNGI